MNPEHLAILKQGVKVFNWWRENNKLVRPDLFGFDLQGFDLQGANFAGARLTQVNFRGANLSRANLGQAILEGASFIDATLCNADFTGAYLAGADFQGADLSDVIINSPPFSRKHLLNVKTTNVEMFQGNPEQLEILRQGTAAWDAWRAQQKPSDVPGALSVRGANLAGADLRSVDLRGADLFFVDFSGANLAGAQFEGARLGGARLDGAVLQAANLRSCVLVAATFEGADLTGADLTGAVCNSTDFRRANLQSATLSGIEFRSAYFFTGNGKHLAIMSQSVEVWNNWRRQYADLHPDLTGANFSGFHLNDVNLSGADLRSMQFIDAGLQNADLHGADLTHANLSGASMRGANLSNAVLVQTRLARADLSNANLTGANLSEADLGKANLSSANLSGANLQAAHLDEANLTRANLSGANLIGAGLTRAILSNAILTGCDLSNATLEQATMVATVLDGASLSGCRVYGVAAWGLDMARVKNQANLVITPDGEAAITVDNLEVAQFIYLMLHNQKIREVIDTVTGKGVLILGRFTSERKAVLDGVKDRLRQHNFVPMVFDWDKPSSRDLTETVQLLANMSRFVVADITDAKSIPQELMSIVPHMPSVPIRPIILSAQREYAMFEHFKPYPWVLPVFAYDNTQQLLDNIVEALISPVLAWEANSSRQADLDTQLQAEKEENARLRAALQAKTSPA